MRQRDNEPAEDREQNPVEGGAAAAGEPGAARPASPDRALLDQIEKLTAEKQELTNTLLRRQADFDNYRKRIEKERHDDRHRGAETVVEHLLPILDAFDRALAGEHDHKSAHGDYRKGFELIRRQLWDVLSKQGLRRIEANGMEFDPQFHHAIERVESAKHPEGTVIGELQPGYLFHERVLRPAMVRVSTQPEAQSAHAAKPER
ncbi:MAG TPA: nucleotide exchange factor GrpE [Candidatus Acidoferrales bacterium]|nr:nucleotide exchange factor GrpE [Candidatus Acidoferrales bacterium]